MKAAIITLGCKVNQYESEAIAERLRKEGYEIAGEKEDADVFIINSCTVTAESNKKVRKTVRSVKREHPGSIVLLTGCMPQAFPEESAKLTEADIVTGNKFNSKIPELIEQYKNKGRLIAVEEHRSGEAYCSDSVSGFRERTRATLKIEDGCNRFCSYCIIPYARGRVRSKPVEEISREARAFADAGYVEIVPVGINLSAYGSDIGSNLVEAVKAAAEPEGIKRVRLGSLEPDHITDEVIKSLSEIPKLCPQFHISLQSGCDRTLKRMNRHYTADEYRKLCEKLRSTFDGCTLTTDLMTGFPGETDEDFLESLEFVKEIKFLKVHVFPYSEREGTPAARMDNSVPRHIREQRAVTAIKEADAIRRDFFEAQRGRTLSVLAEKETCGFYTGYTANYIPVKFTGDSVKDGEITDVFITDVDEDRCLGIKKSDVR
ncbi:MAG: tRNA (N(6)-L-threonylcarbamoyladenosine(37)-C(2))-methylthiotransferase MtaB [Clostridia bacterium]|nr:tRNA (N(6)-L-threonylcarbamoyladenosine(37)-C(2))-methylthiotransferase MtaB [Clostridia bacterium]